MSRIEQFQTMLDKGMDNALLRYSLGNEYLKEKDFANACLHFSKALEHDENYSAAWKLYAKSLTEMGEIHKAISAYTKGIEIAERKGDKQAVKEMQVFLKRLTKS